jgi:hypothetical protein
VLRSQTVGVWEAAIRRILDRLRWFLKEPGSTNKDFGTITKQTQVKITNAAHPLAGGLSGTVSVVTASGTLSWGKPNANAAAVATAASDTTKTLIFGYATGAVMPGLTAPARRVGLFMFDTSPASFTTNGGLLFARPSNGRRAAFSLLHANKENDLDKET